MSSQIFLLSSPITTSMQAQVVKQHIRELKKKIEYKNATLTRMEKKKIVLETQIELMTKDVVLYTDNLNNYEVRKWTN